MKPILTDSTPRKDSARRAAIRQAVREVGSINRRDWAAGRLTRHLCEVLDTHPGAASRIIDVGENRAQVRPGTRVCAVSRLQIRESKQSIRILGRALCVLDCRPESYVLSASASLALDDYSHVEVTAETGLSVFGVASEAALLAISAALVARERRDWAEAKRLYLILHDCQIDSYKRIGFAAAAMAAVEWDDRSAAIHFYLSLASMGVQEGRAMLSQVVAYRAARGERRHADDLLRRLTLLVGLRPIAPNE